MGLARGLERVELREHRGRLRLGARRGRRAARALVPRPRRALAGGRAVGRFAGGAGEGGGGGVFNEISCFERPSE